MAKPKFHENLTLNFGHRFYSDAVLGGVHRAQAIEEWVKLREGQPVALERALAAFDQFVLHSREGDLEEVSKIYTTNMSSSCSK